jgi:hypothetical protein
MTSKYTILTINPPGNFVMTTDERTFGAGTTIDPNKVKALSNSEVPKGRTRKALVEYDNLDDQGVPVNPVVKNVTIE